MFEKTKHLTLRLTSIIFVVSIAACAPNKSLVQFEDEQALQASLLKETNTALEKNPDYVGIGISLYGKDPARNFDLAVSTDVNPSFSSQTPVRLASVTKVFVAATALKLLEEGKLDLNAPISELVSKQHADLLRQDGYALENIKLKHLLNHTSGLPNHADLAYIGIVKQRPQHQWTRTEQVELAVTAHDPLAKAGSLFSYSDTGYILLGEIIERSSGLSLAQAVREAMNLDNLQLESTWWERVEAPSTPEQRAQQFLKGLDTSTWDASLDLYGGGGLVSSTNDLAKLGFALMQGEFFSNPSTLQVMTAGSGEFTAQYRYGLFPEQIGTYQAYSHSGFWGVYWVYVPELELSAAGVVLEQSGFQTMKALVHQAILQSN